MTSSFIQLLSLFVVCVTPGLAVRPLIGTPASAEAALTEVQPPCTAGAAAFRFADQPSHRANGPAGGCMTREQRAEWDVLSRADFKVADTAERQRRALDLVGCLGDPDPAVRDRLAFAALSAWLRTGALDEATRLALAEQLWLQVEADEDAAGFRRPFAALALAEVARADRLSPALPDQVRHRMIGAAVRFMETTRDHRGFDEQDGWRHAVAHGADLVLQLGLHPATTAAEVRRLLRALAAQVAPAGVSYISGEPDRLARAVFFIHNRGLLPTAYWSEWFASIGSPAPLAGWSESWTSTATLARRHDVVAFLRAIAFAARANPGPESDRLGELAHRELLRVERGEPESPPLADQHAP